MMSAPFLILAPMRGITTCHYRQAFVNHFGGLDAAVAPFIPTVCAERINLKLLQDILRKNNSNLPLTPQLIGNKADHFIQMMHALNEQGFTEVNWNLGCPHKPIRNKYRGSGLLPFPDRVDAFLEQVCAQSPCRISVKVRLGISDNTQLLRLVPILNRHPLSEVIIHPRTAEQMYDGTVDIDAFESALAELTHPACYNGDIVSANFYRMIQARFPHMKRFMLGRGLLADPFLCETIKQLVPTTDASPIDRIAAFHEDLLARYTAVLFGEKHVLGKMKEFWTYQSIPLSNGEALFKKLKKAQQLSSYRACVDAFLSTAEWTADVFAPKRKT